MSILGRDSRQMAYSLNDVLLSNLLDLCAIVA